MSTQICADGTASGVSRKPRRLLWRPPPDMQTPVTSASLVTAIRGPRRAWVYHMSTCLSMTRTVHSNSMFAHLAWCNQYINRATGGKKPYAMKLKKLVLFGVVITSGVGICTGAAVAYADGAVPAPDEVTSSGEFFYEDTIDAAWAAEVRAFPNELPHGVEFPKTAPAFFHPNDGKEYSFETNLPAQIVARFWRCSLLYEDIKATWSRSASPSQEAVITEQLKSETWENVPEVDEVMDVDAYLEDVEDIAADAGVEPALAEYEIDCGVYEEYKK